MSRYIPTNFAPKLYSDWYLLIKKLTPTKQSEVIRAIFEYPDFTPEGVDCWDFLSSRLADQYERFMKNREARTEAAKKGAAARWTDKEPTHSKKESVNSRFVPLANGDTDILNALSDSESGLSIFLSTGEGYEETLSRPEREFVDQGAVRELCLWHKKINPPKKPIKKSVDTSELFEKFWSVFPPQRKCDKAKCVVKFHNVVSGGVDPELIIQKAIDYSKTDEVARKFAAMPMTWLNQERWKLDFSATSQQKTEENPL